MQMELVLCGGIMGDVVAAEGELDTCRATSSSSTTDLNRLLGRHQRLADDVAAKDGA